jgi:serine/threonine-protein kinase RsbW
MSEQDVLWLDLPATSKYLGVLGACITEMLRRAEGVDDLQTVAYGIQLAAHEICVNIVEHAYTGYAEGRIKIGLMIVSQPRRFVVELADNGRPYDPSTLAPLQDDLQNRGRGLLLVHKLMDEVLYQRLPDGNHWRLVKQL